MIYWDTDAFLGHLQGEKGKVELCAGTLERAEKGELLIVTSALTIAEVLWQRGSPKLPKKKASILRKYFRRSCFRIHNVTRAIAEGAQDVVWNHGAQPKDAIHIATALAHKILVLETFDKGLLGLTGKIGKPPLIIRKPLPPSQGNLGI